jgi:hypothetical protein
MLSRSGYTVLSTKNKDPFNKALSAIKLPRNGSEEPFPHINVLPCPDLYGYILRWTTAQIETCYSAIIFGVARFIARLCGQDVILCINIVRAPFKDLRV